MNTRRRNAALIASLLLVAALIAAFYWQPLAGWLHPTPPPLPPEKLTIAVSYAYIGSGLVLLAASKGYFLKEGLEVTLQPHTSGTSALDAVIGEQAEIATVSGTPVMFAVMKNVPLAIVGTIASAVRSHGIVARRDRGVSAPADLKGKEVGVVLGSDAHYLLTVILSSHGISPDDVKIRNIRTEAMTAALSAGQVDAVATWEPWLSDARKAAGANGVAMYPETGFSVGFHIAGRREFVRDHPAAMQKLLRALLEAERYLGAQPEAARAIIRAATKTEPAVFDAAWPHFKLRLTLSQGMLTLLEDEARWSISNGFAAAQKVPNPLESIYLDAMLAVKPQAVSIVR